MTNKTIPTLMVASAVSAVSALSAMAQTTVITETHSFAGIIGNSDTLSFSQFAGPLTDIFSVEWCYHFDISGGNLLLDNDANTTQTVTATLGADFTVTSTTPTVDGSFAPIFSNLSTSTSGNFTLGADDGDAEVGGLSSFSSVGADFDTLVGAPSSSVGSGIVNSAVISSYVGAGTIDLVILGNGTLNTGGNLVQGQFNPVDSAGSITLKYTLIDPIPEPSSMVLSLVGFAGLLMRRRR